MARARDADRDAIDALFRRYREPLRRALRKLLGARYRRLVADSEDAAHDAILSSLGRIDRFEYRGRGSFLAWLLRTAEFEMLSALRRLETKKREGGVEAVDLGGEPEPPAGGPTVTQIAAAGELEDRVRACLDELPDKEREVVILRRFMNLEMNEVCAELDLPTAGAARALLSRAQARLVGIMQRHGVRDLGT